MINDNAKSKQNRQRLIHHSFRELLSTLVNFVEYDNRFIRSTLFFFETVIFLGKCNLIF